MSSTTYRVLWAPTTPDAEIAKQGPALTVKHMTANVKIIDGYTTEADIPMIIAVSRTGRQSDAGFVNVISSEIISQED